MDLGLRRAIQALFRSAAWVKALLGPGSAARADRRSFWASSECNRLRAAFNGFAGDGEFDKPWTLLFDLMVDWAQPFKGRAYSTGLFSIRCSTLDDMHRCKDFNMQPLLVMKGPKEPENVQGILSWLARNFSAAVKSSAHAINVTFTDPGDSSVSRTVRVVPVLSGIMCDTMVRVCASLQGEHGLAPGDIMRHRMHRIIAAVMPNLHSLQLFHIGAHLRRHGSR